MNFIHRTAIIGSNVELGDNVVIGPFCVIGTPAEHPREPYIARGTVIVGNNVKLYKLVTVDSPIANDGMTIVGDGCTMMAHSHLGHDVQLGRDVAIATGAKLGGHSLIGDYCNIGLNAVAHQRTILARGTMLGACSFAKGEYVNEFRILVGSPARDIGENKVLIKKLIDEGVFNLADLSKGKVK